MLTCLFVTAGPFCVSYSKIHSNAILRTSSLSGYRHCGLFPKPLPKTLAFAKVPKLNMVMRCYCSVRCCGTLAAQLRLDKCRALCFTERLHLDAVPFMSNLKVAMALLPQLENMGSPCSTLPHDVG